MQVNSPTRAALAAFLLCAAVSAQVPPEIQDIRTDALVYVTDELGTKLPEAAVTFVVPIGQVLVTVYTDQNGIAYCGDRDSQLSVFQFGQDDIAFSVQRPGFNDAAVRASLPAVENACNVNTKVCQTFHVRMVPTTGSVLPPETPAHVPTMTAVQNPPMCQYREVFVRDYTALCHESTMNYASVFFTHGVCASPIDWSNTDSQKREYEVSWSTEITAEASQTIEKVLGAKLGTKHIEAGKEVRTHTSTVVFQGKLGTTPVSTTLCGYSCMNASQKVIVTQLEVRCCIRQNGYGCLEWGVWRSKGGPTETRVNTGFCTTEAALYPCANPPSPIPGCAR
ncbi:MAG: hypothetical protein ACK58X_00520 [Planctomycetota bacterium]